MKFLIDAQLPPSLARLLCEHGHEALHVYDVLPPDTPDEEIWPWAIRGGYILVTKDEDFAEWTRLRNPAPAVVWLRIGNLKKRAMKAKLLPLLPELVTRMQSGETLIEIF